MGDALALMTVDSIAPISEDGLEAENYPKAFNSIVTNDIPKLYICSSWGIQTREELVEYNKWLNEQIEKNNLDISIKPLDPSDEYVDNFFSQCEQFRNDYLYPYTEKMGNCEVIYLAGDHMIYEQKTEESGALIKEFIDALK